MKRKTFFPGIIFLTVTALCAMTPAAGKIPLIYTTDLLHPHSDPDDFFDLATLFAYPQFDIRAIIIDLGEREVQPACAALRQMMYMTGKGRVPDRGAPAREKPAASSRRLRLAFTLQRVFNDLSAFSCGRMRILRYQISPP
jgi:hypothetical protein